MWLAETYRKLASKGSVEVLRFAREDSLVSKELLSAEFDGNIRELFIVEEARTR